MAPHSSTLAWKIPWTEEPGRLQSMASLRVGHDLIDFTFTFHFHALEKEMTTHSSVLAWRIPGTEEPGGLPSMGSHRVRHDWSDLAPAAVQSVQLLSGVQLFVTPWTAAHQDSMSITNSQSLLKLMPILSAMSSNYLLLCPPLLLPSSIFLSIRVFSYKSVIHLRWPKYWSFSFSISPSNEYSGIISFRIDWLNVLAVQGDSWESFPTPQFKNINSSVLGLLYGPTLTSVHDYWKNHSFD